VPSVVFCVVWGGCSQKRRIVAKVNHRRDVNQFKDPTFSARVQSQAGLCVARERKNEGRRWRL
jgi:hypothetical protein